MSIEAPDELDFEVLTEQLSTHLLSSNAAPYLQFNLGRITIQRLSQVVFYAIKKRTLSNQTKSTY